MHKTKIIRVLHASLLAIFLFGLVSVAQAQTVIGTQCANNSGCNSGQVCDQNPSSPTYQHCTGSGAQTAQPASAQSQNSSGTLYNPVHIQGNLVDLLINIMKVFLGIIATWTVVFIVISGFRMVVSQGNTEAVEVAKKGITWAVLGLVIAILSFVIVAVLQNFIGATPQPSPTSYLINSIYGI